MIEFTKGFKASDNKVYGSLQEAQNAEIRILVEESDSAPGTVWNATEIAGFILDYQDKIMDILTTTESSKPKARKINGGTKKRQSKTPAVVEEGKAA